MSALSGYPKLNTVYLRLRWSIALATSILSRLYSLPASCLSYIWSSQSSHTRQQDPSHAVLQWVSQLEEEAAIDGGLSKLNAFGSVLVTGVAGPGPSTINRRHEQIAPLRRRLPDFYAGSYEDALRTAQADAVALCVVLVSEEHDDVGYFVRNTLTDINFNDLLKDHGMIVWGGDVKDFEAYQASEKLSATTFPFVAFVALQPRSSASTQRNSSASPSAALTVLSRHEGPAWDGDSNNGPTSAPVLCDHLSNHLLPRVKPFLERLRAVAQERKAHQQLRQQQDEAFALTARLDREKMDAKLMAATQVDDRRIRYETQMSWYRYARRALTPPEPDSPIGNVRISVKLQDGRRFVRLFRPTETLTSLYAFVASQLIPGEFDSSTDPDQPPSRLSLLGETPWSFQLALAYPRKEIPWDQDKFLSEVPELRGGQVVVEFTRHDIFDDGATENNTAGDGDYSTEEE